MLLILASARSFGCYFFTGVGVVIIVFVVLSCLLVYVYLCCTKCCMFLLVLFMLSGWLQQSGWQLPPKPLPRRAKRAEVVNAGSGTHMHMLQKWVCNH